MKYKTVKEFIDKWRAAGHDALYVATDPEAIEILERVKKDRMNQFTELKSDFSLIDDKEAKDHPAYPAFVDEMSGCMYGYDAINDAWRWFKAGWIACHQ